MSNYYIMSEKLKELKPKQIENKLMLIEKALPTEYHRGEILRKRLNTIKLSDAAKQKLAYEMSIAIPVTITGLFTILAIYRREYYKKHFQLLGAGIKQKTKKTKETKETKGIKKKASYVRNTVEYEQSEEDIFTEQFLKFVGIPVLSTLGIALIAFFAKNTYESYTEEQKNKDAIEDVLLANDDYPDMYYKRVKTGGKLDLSDKNVVEKMTLEFFERFGLLQDYNILQIKICRVPISENARSKIKLLGGVKYNDLKDEFGFDDLYHTYFEIKLERNHVFMDIIYEKNEFSTIRNLDNILKPKAFKPEVMIIKFNTAVLSFGEFVHKA